MVERLQRKEDIWAKYTGPGVREFGIPKREEKK